MAATLSDGREGRKEVSSLARRAARQFMATGNNVPPADKGRRWPLSPHRTTAKLARPPPDNPSQLYHHRLLPLVATTAAAAVAFPSSPLPTLALLIFPQPTFSTRLHAELLITDFGEIWHKSSFQRKIFFSTTIVDVEGVKTTIEVGTYFVKYTRVQEYISNC